MADPGFFLYEGLSSPTMYTQSAASNLLAPPPSRCSNSTGSPTAALLHPLRSAASSASGNASSLKVEELVSESAGSFLFVDRELRPAGGVMGSAVTKEEVLLPRSSLLSPQAAATAATTPRTGREEEDATPPPPSPLPFCNYYCLQCHCAGLSLLDFLTGDHVHHQGASVEDALLFTPAVLLRELQLAKDQYYHGPHQARERHRHAALQAELRSLKREITHLTGAARKIHRELTTKKKRRRDLLKIAAEAASHGGQTHHDRGAGGSSPSLLPAFPSLFQDGESGYRQQGHIHHRPNATTTTVTTATETETGHHHHKQDHHHRHQHYSSCTTAPMSCGERGKKYIRINTNNNNNNEQHVHQENIRRQLYREFYGVCGLYEAREDYRRKILQLRDASQRLQELSDAKQRRRLDELKHQQQQQQQQDANERSECIKYDETNKGTSSQVRTSHASSMVTNFSPFSSPPPAQQTSGSLATGALLPPSSSLAPRNQAAASDHMDPAALLYGDSDLPSSSSSGAFIFSEKPRRTTPGAIGGVTPQRLIGTLDHLTGESTEGPRLENTSFHAHIRQHWTNQEELEKLDLLIEEELQALDQLEKAASQAAKDEVHDMVRECNSETASYSSIARSSSSFFSSRSSCTGTSGSSTSSSSNSSSSSSRSRSRGLQGHNANTSNNNNNNNNNNSNGKGLGKPPRRYHHHHHQPHHRHHHHHNNQTVPMYGSTTSIPHTTSTPVTSGPQVSFATPQRQQKQEEERGPNAKSFTEYPLGALSTTSPLMTDNTTAPQSSAASPSEGDLLGLDVGGEGVLNPILDTSTPHMRRGDLTITPSAATREGDGGDTRRSSTTTTAADGGGGGGAAALLSSKERRRRELFTLAEEDERQLEDAIQRLCEEEGDEEGEASESGSSGAEEEDGDEEGVEKSNKKKAKKGPGMWTSSRLRHHPEMIKQMLVTYQMTTRLKRGGGSGSAAPKESVSSRGDCSGLPSHGTYLASSRRSSSSVPLSMREDGFISVSPSMNDEMVRHSQPQSHRGRGHNHRLGLQDSNINPNNNSGSYPDESNYASPIVGTTSGGTGDSTNNLQGSSADDGGGGGRRWKVPNIIQPSAHPHYRSTHTFSFSNASSSSSSSSSRSASASTSSSSASSSNVNASLDLHNNNNKNKNNNNSVKSARHRRHHNNALSRRQTGGSGDNLAAVAGLEGGETAADRLVVSHRRTPTAPPVSSRSGGGGGGGAEDPNSNNNNDVVLPSQYPSKPPLSPGTGNPTPPARDDEEEGDELDAGMEGRKNGTGTGGGDGTPTRPTSISNNNSGREKNSSRGGGGGASSGTTTPISKRTATSMNNPNQSTNSDGLMCSRSQLNDELRFVHHERHAHPDEGAGGMGADPPPHINNTPCVEDPMITERSAPPTPLPLANFPMSTSRRRGSVTLLPPPTPEKLRERHEGEGEAVADDDGMAPAVDARASTTSPLQKEMMLCVSNLSEIET